LDRDLVCPIGARVIDDDDLNEIFEAGGLLEDGFDAGPEVALFIERRDDEAESRRNAAERMCQSAQ
jgi:hypothetical protein